MGIKRKVIYVEEGVETYTERRLAAGSFKNESALFRYLLALGITADMKLQQGAADGVQSVS